MQNDLEQLIQDAGDEPEIPLPSLEEQKKIAAELKALEEQGKLTPEILEQYFAHFYATKQQNQQ
ncbi:restriction endonuclease subunit S [Vibrio sp. SS-MA-C1-2]|uniref:restriction endonuclease subunit S n=1 Tax=Vibrio sp. SS-MA-C1-2 TaxID=2908646 RepID=UPI001F1B8484|nr:restriction endonuclease subunit S [Vibrio sp. SS-MA-C1-2]UJF17505.1 restriction endonuclease subunit S [Vibrio sp. SS-MA-C1-2]